MKSESKHLLRDLVSFARGKGIAAQFWLHAEQSSLMRFANGAVSLNTTENLLTLDITAYRGNARGTCSLVTNMAERDRMHAAILDADELARHAVPVKYPLSFTPMPALDDDDRHADKATLRMTATRSCHLRPDQRGNAARAAAMASLTNPREPF